MTSALLIVGYLLYYLSTAIYTVSEQYWTARVLSVVLDGLAFCSAFVIIRSESDRDLFVTIVRAVGTAASIVVIVLSISGKLDEYIWTTVRAELLLPDYLRLGLLSGAALVTSVAYPCRFRLFSCTCCISALLLLGGRGPVLAALLCIAIDRLAAFRESKRRVPTWIGAAAAAIPILGFAWWFGGPRLGADSLPLALKRLMALGTDWETFEESIRLEVFQVALGVWFDHLWFGTGIGGYGIAAYQLDVEANPHNLVLEVAAETGIVGLLLFVPGVVRFVHKLWQWIGAGTPSSAVSALMLFMTCHYMKSGGFFSARDLYMLAGVAAGVATYSACRISNRAMTIHRDQGSSRGSRSNRRHATL